MVDVSIVIVSYNTKEMTIACLHSVYDQTNNLSFEIIVIDNASADGSADAIANEFPNIHLIRSSENLGFAVANNKGFLQAKGKYVLLLNSDTLLLGNGIKGCWAYIESNKMIGVLGCRAILPNGQQQKTIYRDLNLFSLFVNIFVPSSLQRKSKFFGRQRYIGINLDKCHFVDVVAGCFMLVRRDVILQVGPLDEEFFFYGEEAEWCNRIRKAQWKIGYYPDAKILHYGGGSTSSISVKKAIFMAKGQLLLLEKIRGKRVAYLGNVLMLVRDIPRVCLWGILKLLPEKYTKKMNSILLPSITRFPLHVRYFFSIVNVKASLSSSNKDKGGSCDS